MKTYLLAAIALAMNATTEAQNVGIGTTMPANRLHIVHTGDVGFRMENNTGPNSEIQFRTGGENKGLVGYYNGRMEIVSTTGEPVTLGSGFSAHLTVTASGNIVLGDLLFSAEKLLIPTGNILMQNSPKGIMLNAADRPLITRAFDPFTSGANIGLGRWGLFMEPSRLVLGIPDIIGKRVEIAGYNANSTRNTLLTIDEDGAMRRPAQGNANLLPICMGTISTFGAIVSGTGNFTADYDGPAGTLDITITGHSYNRTNYLAMATCYQEQGNKAFATVVENAGKLRIWRYSDGGSTTNQSVGFIVYKLN